MKNRKWLKILLVLLAVVIMGVVFSCQSNPQPEPEKAVIEETGSKEAEPASETRADESSPEAADETETTETTAEEPKLCVHVCGCVVNPGVYYLPSGSRFHEAVKAAGGLTEDAAGDYVNLAKVISDGEQVYIPSVAETENKPHEVPAEAEEASANKKLDLNSATEQELTSIPGIGEAKAKAIVNYRKENGAFSDIQEIKKVSGIGNSLFEQIKDYIKV